MDKAEEKNRSKMGKISKDWRKPQYYCIFNTNIWVIFSKKNGFWTSGHHIYSRVTNTIYCLAIVQIGKLFCIKRILGHLIPRGYHIYTGESTSDGHCVFEGLVHEAIFFFNPKFWLIWPENTLIFGEINIFDKKNFLNAHDNFLSGPFFWEVPQMVPWQKSIYLF